MENRLFVRMTLKAEILNYTVVVASVAYFDIATLNFVKENNYLLFFILLAATVIITLGLGVIPRYYF